MHFEKQHGSYYLLDGSAILYMADVVGIAFDAETGTLLKHGPQEDVMAWVRKARGRLGFALFSQVEVLSSNRFEVDDLNRLLTHSGYAKQLALKVMGEEPLLRS